MNQAFKLYRLQQVDTQLDEVRARLAEIERKLSDDELVSAARITLKQAELALDAARKAVAAAESDVQEQQDKLKQNQASLYGGKISNPKELQDLQREAESLGKHLSELEDIELEKMQGSESAEAGLANAKSELDVLLAQRGVEMQALRVEQDSQTVENDRLAKERETALSGVEGDALEVYDGLRKSKAGLAVAKMNDKTCSACGAELSAALAQAARSPSELARCASCKRILYAG